MVVAQGERIVTKKQVGRIFGVTGNYEPMHGGAGGGCFQNYSRTWMEWRYKLARPSLCRVSGTPSDDRPNF